MTLPERIIQLLPLEVQQKTYIGELPTDVDNCIAVGEVAGPFGTYFAHDQMNEPLIKVVVRDSVYPRGYELIQACKNTLASYADATTSLVLKNDVMYFGRDDARRNIWQLTFKVFNIGG